jgi:hypothetical protein
MGQHHDLRRTKTSPPGASNPPIAIQWGYDKQHWGIKQEFGETSMLVKARLHRVRQTKIMKQPTNIFSTTNPLKSLIFNMALGLMCDSHG